MTLSDTDAGPRWVGRIMGLPAEHLRYAQREPCLTISGVDAEALDDPVGTFFPLRGHAVVALRLAAAYGYVLGDGAPSGSRSWRWQIHRAEHRSDRLVVAETLAGEGLVAALLQPVLSDI